ncbi:metallophosphoesterase [Candidatus Woesearchaeota archaeon]|nr:metallophosphoesterase [Candidatus Woesearchaeota archaeon]
MKISAKSFMQNMKLFEFKMIGIISDTHENEEAIKKAVKIFKDKNPAFVVHCGDIISPPILEHFNGLKMKFVFGNNDGEKNGLNAKAMELGYEEITDEKKFEYNGKKLYAYHGTSKEKLNAAIKSNKYDYILTGHTHIKRDEMIGKTRVINPGALFRIYPYTIALLDIENDKLEFVKV